ncbi:MAG: transglutaminase TgpA family protein [Actinomycetota bacterium]
MLRSMVLAMSLVAVLAVAAQAALDRFTAVGSLLLIPLGSWVSYRRRTESNFGLKLMLAAALLLALANFLAQVRLSTSVDEARIPLASLFVWVQVLHSFDLPRRRDLAFSVVAAMALMAEAASLSLDQGFGLFLLPFAGLAAAWLYLSDRAGLTAEAAAATISRQTSGRRSKGAVARGVVRTGALSIVIVMLATGLVFVVTPRLPGRQILAPPFSLVNRVAVPGFAGGVTNPTLPSGRGVKGEPGAVRGVGYPGFGSAVDLRLRGRLSEALVMRVRAPQPALWRGQVYDTFDGTTWTESDDKPLTIPTGWGPPVFIPATDPEGAEEAERTVVQTFYVVGRQPNIVFGAHRITQVYFPEGPLAVDSEGSVRAPVLLEPDTIYSVVSRMPGATPDMLRSAGQQIPPGLVERYTQLPADLPPRVVQLAHRITDPHPNVFDKVAAVERWLHAHTRYQLDVPPDPEGISAVDWFLFERRTGLCEHIASAMAVLLRAVGIPTRFVVGFGPGERNVLTGYFDVRQSDAHGWIEVYYHNVAWMQYDPTFGVPPAASESGWFVGPELLRAVGRFLAWVTPDALQTAGRRLASALASGAAVIVRWWPGVAALALAGALLWGWARARHRRRLRGPPPTGAAAAFESMCRSFEARGRPRAPSATPSEHLVGLLAADALARAERADLELVVRTFERARFAGQSPDDREVEASLVAAQRIKARAQGHASAREPVSR